MPVAAPRRVVLGPAEARPSADAMKPPVPEGGRGPRLIRIPGGTFEMGSNDSEDEGPVHRVTLESFLLDQTEVTVAQYRACVDAGACVAPTSYNPTSEREKHCNYGNRPRDDHPVNCVDWNQATTFCRWANKRLPTEEEWEYAARGPAGRRYVWGDAEPSAELLCWNRKERDTGTCPVGDFPRDTTPEGIHDLTGNVWEWTASLYCLYDNRDCADDVSLRYNFRIVRGGRWSGEDASTTTRNFVPPVRSAHLGFRCAQ